MLKIRQNIFRSEGRDLNLHFETVEAKKLIQHIESLQTGG